MCDCSHHVPPSLLSDITAPTMPPFPLSDITAPTSDTSPLLSDITAPTMPLCQEAMNSFLLFKHSSFYSGASGKLFSLPVILSPSVPWWTHLPLGWSLSHLLQEALLSLHPDSREIRGWHTPLSPLLTLQDVLIEMSVGSIQDHVDSTGCLVASTVTGACQVLPKHWLK